MQKLISWGKKMILFFSKVSGDFTCNDCGWPLCNSECQETETHRKECKFFLQRNSKVIMNWWFWFCIFVWTLLWKVRVTCFGVPNSLYDAILPLRVLMLKITNPRWICKRKWDQVKTLILKLYFVHGLIKTCHVCLREI